MVMWISVCSRATGPLHVAPCVFLMLKRVPDFLCTRQGEAMVSPEDRLLSLGSLLDNPPRSGAPASVLHASSSLTLMHRPELTPLEVLFRVCLWFSHGFYHKLLEVIKEQAGSGGRHRGSNPGASLLGVQQPYSAHACSW